jgi:4-hydroxy-2-oxoheptanedioate aldolase
MEDGELTGLRGRLHAPGPLFWAMAMIPDPAAASALGSSGLDCVVLDAEHGDFTDTSMRACVDALRPTPASTMVRTASAVRAEIQRVLDLGIDGVLVPHIGSAAEAAAVVRAARFSPEGTRRSDQGLNAARHAKHANSRTAVMVIIESRRGVENAAEIAAVPGLDGIVVGPSDLTADLGVPGRLEHPSFREATEKTVTAALDAGLKVTAWRASRSAAEYDAMLVYCFTDKGLLTQATRQALEREREQFSRPGDKDRLTSAGAGELWAPTPYE